MPAASNWTIPNVLTIARFLLTPGFAMAFVNHRFDLAWILFAVAGVTDALDGVLARILRQRTMLGAMLDPLADKVLLMTSFICLALADKLPGWAAVLVVSRDAIIVGGLLVLQFWGVDVQSRIRPTLVGKATTCAQILQVLLVMTRETMGWPDQQFLDVLLLATAGLTMVSGISYVLIGFSFFPVSEDPRR